MQSSFNAIASVVGNPLDRGHRNAFSSDSEKFQHWVEQSAVHLGMKQLIQFDKLRKQPPYFSQALIEEIDKEKIKGWLSCNGGSFCLSTYSKLKSTASKRPL